MNYSTLAVTPASVPSNSVSLYIASTETQNECNGTSTLEHLISKSHYTLQSNNHYNNQRYSQRISHNKRSILVNISPETDENKSKSRIISQIVSQSRHHELGVKAAIRCPNITMQSNEYIAILTNNKSKIFHTLNRKMLNNKLCDPSSAMMNVKLLAVRDYTMINVRQIKRNISQNEFVCDCTDKQTSPIPIIKCHNNNEHMHSYSAIKKSSSYPSQSSVYNHTITPIPSITELKAMHNDLRYVFL